MAKKPTTTREPEAEGLTMEIEDQRGVGSEAVAGLNMVRRNPDASPVDPNDERNDQGKSAKQAKEPANDADIVLRMRLSAALNAPERFFSTTAHSMDHAVEDLVAKIAAGAPAGRSAELGEVRVRRDAPGVQASVTVRFV